MTGIQRMSSSTITATPENALDADDEFWNLEAVTAKTGLSRSTLYAPSCLRRSACFQSSISVCGVWHWLASEIRAWIASRP